MVGRVDHTPGYVSDVLLLIHHNLADLRYMEGSLYYYVICLVVLRIMVVSRCGKLRTDVVVSHDTAEKLYVVRTLNRGNVQKIRKMHHLG